jgi:flagellin-like hook-associated protein FlgL
MTHPIVDGLTLARNPAAATQVASQEAALRRADEVSRVLRRANDVKSQAIDKAPTVVARGLATSTQELSRGTALMQAAEQGLDVISSSLRRIVVLIDEAATSRIGREDLARLQQQLDTIRLDVFRVARQSADNASKYFAGGSRASVVEGVESDVAAPLTQDRIVAGLAAIDLRDVAGLASARREVDVTLQMVSAAREQYAKLNERLATAIDARAGDEDVFMVGPTSLGGIRFETAARAGEAALRLRELIMRDSVVGFAAQASSSRADALRALNE